MSDLKAPSTRKVVPSPSITDEQYNAVVAAAELGDVRLTNSKFFVLPDYFIDEEKNKFSVTRNIHPIIFGPDQKFFIVPVEFDVSVKQGKTKVLSCECKYLVFYTLEATVDAAAVRLFATRHGPNTAYPYFRSYLASLNWSSGADLPPLPIQKQGPRNATKKKRKA